MRFALLFTLFLSCLSITWAQSSIPVAKASSSEPTSARQSSSARAGVVAPRTELIHVEDGGARIDELRVGGQTQSITVQPKDGLPAYQVEPRTGERSWKILGF